MSLHAVNILGINITNSPKNEILEEIHKYLIPLSKTFQKPFVIVTPNPEQLVLAGRDSHFAELLNQADVAIPDGTGLVWARPKDISEVIPGVDFMDELVANFSKQRVPIALIGGQEKVALKAFECLRQKYPGLSGVAMDTPEFSIGPSGLSMKGNIDEYFQNLALDLQKKNIRIVFVGLGAPKQEYFIERLTMSLRGVPIAGTTRQSHKQIASPSERSRNDNMVLMSVGGSFDELSGRLPRAPLWMSRLGLKWLWRLFLEPWRIGRQLALIRFIWEVLQKRYSLK